MSRLKQNLGDQQICIIAIRAEQQAVSSFGLMAKLIKTKWRRAVRLTYKLMARYVQLLASL